MPIVFIIEDDVNEDCVILNNLRKYHRPEIKSFYYRRLQEDIRAAVFGYAYFLILGIFIRPISGGLVHFWHFKHLSVMSADVQAVFDIAQSS